MKNTLYRYFVRRPETSPMGPQQKLQGYLTLAKEMVERARAAESEKQTERALSLLRHAVEVIREGLRLEVPSSGLGPKADSTAAVKQELTNLHERVMNKILDMESAPSNSASNRRMLPQSPKKLKVARHAARVQNTASSVVDGVRRVGKAARDVISGEAARHREQILGEMLVTRPGVEWEDIAGLPVAKQALYESVILPSLRPDLFQGLRAPPRGLLLYGPPGNGKTLLAKALASKADASFFNISASSLTSKWVGEGEKLVRALFEVAAEMSPSIIFIDEIDSILSSRSTNENEASRKLKTEFLVQFDGLASSEGRILVIGATNRPHELDDAALRRLVKRIYIPLPDAEARLSIVKHLFHGQQIQLTDRQLGRVVSQTDGYSASDLTALCKEASMAAIRELGADVATVRPGELRSVRYDDFAEALKVIKPSVNASLLRTFDDFTRDFGAQ